MSVDDWRYKYLSGELQEYRKRLEEAEKQVVDAKNELDALEWQRNKFKAIFDMLEVACKVNVSKESKNVSCVQTQTVKEDKQ
jgi:hypothetical protein